MTMPHLIHDGGPHCPRLDNPTMFLELVALPVTTHGWKGSMRLNSTDAPGTPGDLGSFHAGTVRAIE